MNTQEQTMKTTWYFQNSDGEFELHDKTEAEAFFIAGKFGWQPSVWYKPWTWNNFYIRG
jgi:hypothetical protein